MKRLMLLVCALGLSLGLAGCGGDGTALSVKGTSQALLSAQGVFSEELVELDRDIFVPLYTLDGETLAGGVAYASTGATAEELAVLEFADETAAQAAVAAVEDHLAYQKEANEGYRPQEMPKLEDAVIRRDGRVVLFLVAADYRAAERAMK